MCTIFRLLYMLVGATKEKRFVECVVGRLYIGLFGNKLR